MLEIRHEGRVLMISSAGCNAQEYLLDKPAEIHCADINPRQNALLELKIRMAEQLEWGDFFRFFGEGAHLQYREHFDKVLPVQSDPAAQPSGYPNPFPFGWIHNGIPTGICDPKSHFFPGDNHSASPDRPCLYVWQRSPRNCKRMTDQLRKMEKYYRWHAPVYDITRWTFLFGRKRLIHLVMRDYRPSTIVEIGCGTGFNLLNIGSLYPESKLTGLDASVTMLHQCRRKLDRAGIRANLQHRLYDETYLPDPKPDMILFSYSLCMINPGWEYLLDLAFRDLRSGGIIAVVDFHDSPVGWFRDWMKYNHVMMEGHLLPALRERFSSLTEEIRPAFGGMWRYLLFLGIKELDG